MVAFTTNQWIIVGLVLVLGWLLGLASRSGAGRWKRAYHEERDAHQAYRRENEERIRAANERIAELDRLAPHFSAGTAGAVGAAASGRRDDLTQIRGIDRDMELRLNDAGISAFRDIARLDRSEEAALEGRLGLEPDRIAREAWSDQAAMLSRGRIKEHDANYG